MAKIIELVIEKKLAMVDNEGLANRVQELAQAAVLGGRQSRAWEEYMTQFCDKDKDGFVNDDQLRRLTGADNSSALDKNRAYLVANGMCGSFTRAHFEVNVQSIDEGLNVPGAQPGCLPS